MAYIRKSTMLGALGSYFPQNATKPASSSSGVRASTTSAPAAKSNPLTKPNGLSAPPPPPGTASSTTKRGWNGGVATNTGAALVAPPQSALGRAFSRSTAPANGSSASGSVFDRIASGLGFGQSNLRKTGSSASNLVRDIFTPSGSAPSLVPSRMQRTLIPDAPLPPPVSNVIPFQPVAQPLPQYNSPSSGGGGGGGGGGGDGGAGPGGYSDDDDEFVDDEQGDGGPGDEYGDDEQAIEHNEQEFSPPDIDSRYGSDNDDGEETGGQDMGPMAPSSAPRVREDSWSYRDRASVSIPDHMYEAPGNRPGAEEGDDTMDATDYVAALNGFGGMSGGVGDFFKSTGKDLAATLLNDAASALGKKSPGGVVQVAAPPPMSTAAKIGIAVAIGVPLLYFITRSRAAPALVAHNPRRRRRSRRR